jgi:hypothetical protein
MFKLLFLIGAFGIVTGTVYAVSRSLNLGHGLERGIEIMAVCGSVAVLVVIALLLCGDSVYGHREIVGLLERFLYWLHN